MGISEVYGVEAKPTKKVDTIEHFAITHYLLPKTNAEKVKQLYVGMYSQGL